MAESRATVPDFELRAEVDMAELVALREQLRAATEPLPSYNDFIVKAVALALREFPRVNGAYRDAELEEHSRVNVGIAVAAEDALVVPTIFDADRKSVGEIASASRELAAKVRDGSITPAELAGGTFTVSNLGMYGVDSFSAVINPPQAAILAVGSLRPRPVVDEDGVARGAPHGQPHPRLRPPDPVRRRRRALPRSGARAARAPASRCCCSARRDAGGGRLPAGCRGARGLAPVGGQRQRAEPVVDRHILGLEPSPEASAASSSSAAKSTSLPCAPSSAWTICSVAAASGIGTSSSRAASKPRWKSLSSSSGVNVGVKSRLT